MRKAVRAGVHVVARKAGRAAWRGSAVVAVAVGLGACQLAAAPSAEREQLPRRVTDTVRGEGFYLERIAAPPGGRLTIELLDVGAPAPLGQMTLEDPGAPPHAFRIRYAVDALRPASRLAVRATWWDAQGRVWWHTPQPVEVTPHQPSPLRVRMVRAGASTDGASSPESSARDTAPTDAATPYASRDAYQCGDVRLEAWSYPGRGGQERLLLILPERDVWVARMESVPTAYAAAGEEHFALLGPQQARLSLKDQPPMDCVRTALRSPWAQARQAGAALRLLGHEPSWVAVVGPDAAPTLRVERLGQPAWEVARLDRDGHRWRGSAPDGQLVLEVEQQSCTDIAIGTVFPLRATLRLPAQTLQGCGRHLQGPGAH